MDALANMQIPYHFLYTRKLTSMDFGLLGMYRDQTPINAPQ